MDNLIKKSKFLSYILRHHPEEFNIVLDDNGWTDIKNLIENTTLMWDEIGEIVQTDNKQRYSFNKDRTKIRANQGHSIKKVNIKFEKIVPPIYLYHGTPTKNVNSILKNGLNKGNRNYLHLSPDIETAKNVGNRRGASTVLKILAQLSHLNNDCEFYISKNGVYLTDFIPPKYIKKY